MHEDTTAQSERFKTQQKQVEKEILENMKVNKEVYESLGFVIFAYFFFCVCVCFSCWVLCLHVFFCHFLIRVASNQIKKNSKIQKISKNNQKKKQNSFFFLGIMSHKGMENAKIYGMNESNKETYNQHINREIKVTPGAEGIFSGINENKIKASRYTSYGETNYAQYFPDTARQWEQNAARKVLFKSHFFFFINFL